MRARTNGYLIIRAEGGYPFRVAWGGICGKERKGGLIVEIGELCAYNTPLDKLRFTGGMVITKKDAIKLKNLIENGLQKRLTHNHPRGRGEWNSKTSR